MPEYEEFIEKKLHEYHDIYCYGDDKAISNIFLRDYVKIKEWYNNFDVNLLNIYPWFEENYINLQNQVDRLDNIFPDIPNIEYKNLAYKYMARTAAILPLVLANNDDKVIKTRKSGRHMMLCQFHVESNPSMYITDRYNVLGCFGCGTAKDAYLYLKNYEELTPEQAVQLLSQIYLYDTGLYDATLEPLVDKYQKYIMSDEYLERLNIAKDKMLDFSSYYKQAMKVYNQRLRTIERIKKQQYDPDFNTKSLTRGLYLD